MGTLQEFSKGNTNMDIDKNDINRIYDLIHPLTEKVVAIQATLKLLVHQTPCRTLNAHLNAHSLDKRDWKRALTSGLVDLLKMGIVAALTYFLILANGGP